MNAVNASPVGGAWLGAGVWVFGSGMVVAGTSALVLWRFNALART
ncbi:MAG: hypothetical protein WBU92_00675 [Candidatus Dormiibacterota bacterium]